MKLMPEKDRRSDSLHVVLIEDDRAFADMCKLALELAGMEVLLAADARAGLELVARVLPDVIVLDLGLPDANGLAVLWSLKSLEATRHIPVGILSIDGTSATMKQCRSLGAVDYLIKRSTSPALLAELLPAWAAGARGWEL